MPSSEEELTQWKLFKQGDWSAYAYLFNRFFPLLNNYGYKFTRDVSLIEDAIQDLFTNLWTTRQGLATPVSVKNYLYKALRHNLFRKMQHQARFQEIPAEGAIPTELPFDQQLMLAEDEAEQKQRITSCITTLPPRQQEIIFLRFYEDFDYAEIADIMDITVASAYKLLYKALHNMQQGLQG